MPVEKTSRIHITDEAIELIEKNLLSSGIKFDEEHKTFIKDLSTIDLQAVPGSGKTTTLLAKLLILEKYLPFDDGSGILVISHTNTAIDEIRNKISSHCPNLFSYPNFVGTIQSFVDSFLAIPFYTNQYKNKICRIDDEIYRESISTPIGAEFWLSKNPYQKDKVLYESRLNENNELVTNFNSKEFPLKNKNSKTYKIISTVKQKIRERGILCFDDAYFLAIEALRKYPILKQLLQKRFSYVFVDEMQDMDKHQYDLLEDIFYDEGKSISIYQRIGDKQQAIYGEVKLENFWDSSGRRVLNINGSYRFSKEIADIVQCFASERQEIEGKASHKSIKPHLLIYNDNSIGSVIKKFVEIIESKQNTGEIPTDFNEKIKAIGWRKNADSVDKITIRNYFPEFNDNNRNLKIDFSTLEQHLLPSESEKGFGVIRKNIINALLKILRNENIDDAEGRPYTYNRLFNFLNDQNIDFCIEFKLKLYLWSREIVSGNTDVVFEEVKKYFINLLKTIFGITEISQKSKDFINADSSGLYRVFEDEKMVNKKVINIFESNDLEVQVGTIHSIKGETHLATLYLETFYQNDSRKKGEYISYESQRLKEFFKGNRITGKENKRIKESLKMAYVGMSRAKYLLCVAVHIERVKNYLSEIPDSLWEKIII